jgi:hypothetical protein
MRFWPRIKKVSFIFSKKATPKSVFPRWRHGRSCVRSHFGESSLSRFQVLCAYLCMHFSTCYDVWVVGISIFRPRFVLIEREPRSMSVHSKLVQSRQYALLKTTSQRHCISNIRQLLVSWSEIHSLDFHSMNSLSHPDPSPLQKEMDWPKLPMCRHHSVALSMYKMIGVFYLVQLILHV